MPSGGGIHRISSIRIMRFPARPFCSTSSRIASISVMDESPLSDIDALKALRRDLHAHPELGFEEHRTAAIVAARLRQLGLAVTEGIGGTGIVATLGVKRRAVGLRADMDALAMDRDRGQALGLQRAKPDACLRP